MIVEIISKLSQTELGNSRKHCDLHVNISVEWLKTFNLVLEIHVHILLPAELNFFK